MADVIHVLGEGGSVFRLALPLQSDIARRIERGHLRRVNPDGSPFEEHQRPQDGVPQLPTECPALSATKAQWVGYAVAQGMTPDDAEALTRTDLIDRFAVPAAERPTAPSPQVPVETDEDPE